MTWQWFSSGPPCPLVSSTRYNWLVTTWQQYGGKGDEKSKFQSLILQLRDPLELFTKRREFLPGYRFLSCPNMTLAVKRDLKNNSFLRSNVEYRVSQKNATSYIFLDYRDNTKPVFIIYTLLGSYISQLSTMKKSQ